MLVAMIDCKKVKNNLTYILIISSRKQFYKSFVFLEKNVEDRSTILSYDSV